jgi:hypothetical protein
MSARMKPMPDRTGLFRREQRLRRCAMNWRNRLKTAAWVLALSAMTTILTSCAPGGRLYVRIEPPVPIVEVRAVAPGPGYVWIEGYHRWDGGGYVWVRGHWEVPPRPRLVWVPGHWQRESRGWYFVEGRWR